MEAHLELKENVGVELLDKNGIKTNPIQPTIPKAKVKSCIWSKFNKLEIEDELEGVGWKSA